MSLSGCWHAVHSRDGTHQGITKVKPRSSPRGSTRIEHITQERRTARARGIYRAHLVDGAILYVAGACFQDGKHLCPTDHAVAILVELCEDAILGVRGCGQLVHVPAVLFDRPIHIRLGDPPLMLAARNELVDNVRVDDVDLIGKDAHQQAAQLRPVQLTIAIQVEFPVIRADVVRYACGRQLVRRYM